MTDHAPHGVAARLQTLVSWNRAGVPGWHYALAVVAIFLVGAGWAASDERRIGPLGLIAGLSPLLLVATTLIVTLGAYRLVVTHHPQVLDGVLLGLYTVVLHGSAAVVESQPRFPVAWLHAGFVDQVAQRGQLLPEYDARFSWPGFFTTAAAVTDAAGIDPIVVVRWAPVVVELVLVALVMEVAKALGATWRQALVAGWIFVAADWVGQSYFAPQAYGMWLVLASLLVMLRTAERREGAAMVERWVVPLPEVVSSAQTRWWGMLITLTLAVAVIASHQLSPLLLALLLLVLVLVGRLRPEMVVWLVLIMTAAWIVVAARPFWIGHLEDMFGDLGDVSGVLQTAVSDRVADSSTTRELVLYSRFGLTGLVCAVAVVGVWRRWRVNRKLDVVVALAVAPAVLLMAQSYGGEIMLRVVLYMLPFLVLPAAWAFVPCERLGRGAAALAVLLAVLAPWHMVAHFGNEQFEGVTAADVAAVAQADQAPPGTRILVLSGVVPWRFERYQDWGAVATSAGDTLPDGGLRPFLDLDPAGMREALRCNGGECDKTSSAPVYLLITDNQIYDLMATQGMPDDYGIRLIQVLDAQPWLERVYANDEAVLYQTVPGAFEDAEASDPQRPTPISEVPGP